MPEILNFGSLNIDTVYNVPHFVKSGETLSATGIETHAGGKGLNQSIALARAGASVWHAGCIGPDGEILRDVLEKEGVNTQYVSVGIKKTGHAVIQVTPSGLNSILLYKGANHTIGEKQIEHVLQHFSEGDVLVLQNEVNHVSSMMWQANHKGMRIAFNPSPFHPGVLGYPLDMVEIFFLNELEALELAKQADVETALKCLSRQYPNAQIVLTLGKRGVIYQKGTVRLAHGIYNVPVVDTTAAGDTFTGFFIGGTVNGCSAEEALRLASVASSLAVTKKGASTSIPTLEQVQTCKLTPVP